MFLIIFTVFFTCSIGTVSAASGDTIYVDGSSGNDLWNGESETYQSGITGPKCSIKNATRSVNKNGTVIIADGEYLDNNNTHIIINKNMMIKGQSKEGTIINGCYDWIFHIDPGVTVNIKSLTLKMGVSSYNGGAINNTGTLTISDMVFQRNTAIRDGGAIYNIGILTITNCAFTENKADNFGDVIANLGGAICNKGTTTITNCTFDRNSASSYGGAIYNIGNLTTTNCTFKSNIAYIGGAVYNSDILTVKGSDFLNNRITAVAEYGGAIFNIGNLTLNFSRIVGNSQIDVYTRSRSCNVDYNWWGTNFEGTDPTSAGKMSGFTVSKWIILTITANPNTIYKGKLSNIIVDLLHDQNGVYHNPIDDHVPDGLIKFNTSLGELISPLYTLNGVAKSTLSSGIISGVADVWSAVDSQVVHVSINFDNIKPTVRTTDPSNSVNTLPNKMIKITFSEYIKKGNDWIELKNSRGTLIPITKTINGNILTISHKYPLKNDKYILILHTGSVTDFYNNQLAIYTSHFSVDTILPKIISTTPTNLKTNVSKKTTLAVKFSENIKNSTYFNKITIKNLKTNKYVNITKSISGNTVYIKTDTTRIAYTWYQVTIPKSATKDYAGNNLASTYTFKFKTGKL
ncbi:MAG: Ig-like domain-containing protein [Methanobacterium sp. ERen5]|nr:MAG: Ig-like domain-containing protein [Methanobacterium sp. ERen5]